MVVRTTPSQDEGDVPRTQNIRRCGVVVVATTLAVAFGFSPGLTIGNTVAMSPSTSSRMAQVVDTGRPPSEETKTASTTRLQTSAPPPLGSLVEYHGFTMARTSSASVLKSSVVCGGSRVPVEMEPIVVQYPIKMSTLTQSFKLVLPQVRDRLSPSFRLGWIDLGARMYPKGSTNWFERTFASDLSRSHLYLFDVLDLRSGYPPSLTKACKSFTYHVKAAWIHDRGVSIKGKRMARVEEPKEDKMLQSVIKSGVEDKRETWLTESVDIAAFLQKTFQEDDFVMLKMDVEGGEWTILEHLIATRAIKLVDELFIECHDVGQTNTIPESCLFLMNHLRTIGLSTHRWV